MNTSVDTDAGTVTGAKTLIGPAITGSLPAAQRALRGGGSPATPVAGRLFPANLNADFKGGFEPVFTGEIHTASAALA